MLSVALVFRAAAVRSQTTATTTETVDLAVASWEWRAQLVAVGTGSQ